MGRWILSLGLACVILCALSAVCAVAAELPGWLPLAAQPGQVASDVLDRAAATSATAAESRPTAATRGFKQSLETAASQAFKEGKISRWQLAKLRMAVRFRPDAIAEAQACVIDQACQDGLMRSAADGSLDAFDWTALLAFIKELLPLILQIISVLG